MPDQYRIARFAPVALLGALGLAGCRDGEARAAESAPNSAESPRTISLPVAGAPVRHGDLILSVTTTGKVSSDGVVELRTEAAGTVDAVLVRPGDQVKRGQPLVRLDTMPFALAVREAEAAVAQAEVSYRDNIVPDSIVTGQPPSDERRAAALARSGLQAARVRLERARWERARAIIAAPFDGVVDRIPVVQGERLGANQPVATVVDLDRLRIEAAVLEHDLPLIEPGGEALVTSPAAPDRPARGRIAAVLPLVDTTTRAGRVLVELRGERTPLRPGMYADVRLEATRLPGRTIVPARALLERDGRPLVFVARDGRAQWVYVTPGRSNGTETEILPDSATGEIPLAAGDTVLVSGHLTLTHDAPVRLVADSAAGE